MEFYLRHKDYPPLSVEIDDDEDTRFTSRTSAQQQTIDLNRILFGPGDLAIFLRNQFTLTPGHMFIEIEYINI